jgi:cell division initiation protein
MKIGPVDIRNHTFTKKLNGVDESEVRAYLDMVADRLEESIVEGEELRATIDRVEGRVDEYAKLEGALRDSLISAERIAEERREGSEREARIVIKNAEVDAEKILLAARQELGRLRADIDDLRRQKVTYVERFRALLRSQVKILEASVEELDPDQSRSSAQPEARAVLDEVERAEAASRQMPLGYTDPRAPSSPSSGAP